MMHKVIDSATDCRLLHSNITKDDTASVLLHSRLVAICNRLHVPDVKKENILLVAAELASNNIKHAGGRGQIQVWQQPDGILDIVSLDYGPGITDLSLAERDGYSTANTFGKGLGAIRRLSDESYFYTQPLQGDRQNRWSGAVFLARFYLSVRVNRTIKVGLFSRSLSDSHHNGDRIYLQYKGDKFRWLHLDGIGHGEEAQHATSNMAGLVAHHDSLPNILLDAHKRLQDTRGAVGLVGEIDWQQHHVQVIGVGDMHAHLYQNEQLERLSFAAGTLGREHRSMHLQQISFNKRSVFITASDGVRRNWDVNNFVGIFEQHPQLIAYILGNIMGRVSDDQSIVVATL